MSTLIKTAFRVKSSLGTQAGAAQGSPQIQAKDSPKSELRTKPCLRKRPNKKCHNNPAYYKVRSSVGGECRLGLIRCGKRAPLGPLHQPVKFEGAGGGRTVGPNSGQFREGISKFFFCRFLLQRCLLMLNPKYQLLKLL